MRLAVTSPGTPEIFEALQGEGASMGRPSVFLRTSQCNLHCVWCDTPYTWNFKGTEFVHRDGTKFDRTRETVDMDVPDVAARLMAATPRRLVLTGGEPLLQQRELGALCAALKAADPAWHVEIETNGTIAPTGEAEPLIDQFNVSPKLAHSGNAAALALKPDLLAWYAGDARATFKFVISAPEDIAEVDEIVAQSAIPATRVYLMPEGTDSATLRARAAWLEPLCLAHGYNFSDRLHIHLHGDTRGT
ncbi:MAG: 7-carboxy-7-deazaguanine synthase QueE [Hyphomonadaceae bacterium]|nr:7-carboxy-7-deazaguanine synthase QueE [Hyphomonadaceae bacterium]